MSVTIQACAVCHAPTATSVDPSIAPTCAHCADRIVREYEAYRERQGAARLAGQRNADEMQPGNFE